MYCPLVFRRRQAPRLAARINANGVPQILVPDTCRSQTSDRCSGLHWKSLRLAFSAVSHSDYLQLTDGLGSDYLQASLHSALPARILS